MVKVQPVIKRKFILQHLRIVDNLIRNFCISKGQRDGIIPWLDALAGGHPRTKIHIRRIHCNFGRFFELQCIHINFGILYFCQDSVELCVRQYFKAHIAGPALPLKCRRMLKGKATTSVVEQPPGLNTLVEHPVGDPVCLEMIALLLCFHRDEDIGGLQAVGKKNERKSNRYDPLKHLMVCV